jgi:hypothetical protein
MVRTLLKVYMELGSYFLFLQEQLKDIIIITRPTLGGLTRQHVETLADRYSPLWICGGQ